MYKYLAKIGGFLKKINRKVRGFWGFAVLKLRGFYVLVGKDNTIDNTNRY